MEHPGLEVADIFLAHGPAWRQAQHGHLSLGQLKVMSDIEQCRSAMLGVHALRCDACDHVDIAYNSCRNRHCTKCQTGAARRWLKARRSELLPVEYYNVVFTLPALVAALAWHNKSMLYRLLFEIAAQTLCTIAADPRHLGARIGATLVLHTWGSAPTHHPHVHSIVPGGGLSQDGARWVAGGSSCQCACSRACSGGASSKRWTRPIAPGSCVYSTSMRRWRNRAPSRVGWLRSIHHQTAGDSIIVKALIYAIDAISSAPTGTFPIRGSGQIAIACGKG